MATTQLEQVRKLPSAFGGREVIYVKLANAPKKYNDIRLSIIARSENLSKRLVNKNMEFTRNYINGAKLLSPKAKETLLFYLKYKKEGGKIRKIFADGQISAMFEIGVKEHEVSLANPSLQNRSRVKQWMKSHGFGNKQSFIVGKPGTSMAKSQAVRYMEKGFDRTLKAANRQIDLEFQSI